MPRFMKASVIITLLFYAVPSNANTDKTQEGPKPCIWSQPVNISETPDFYTFHGTLVGDSSGYVHAFWGEKASRQEDMTVLAYIVYRYWDGFEWSSPADILVAKSTSAMTANHALTSSDGSRLYVAWTDASGFYVSWAARQDATDARAWRTTQIVSGGPPRAALTIDSKDTLHALYADPNTQDSVKYVKSTDSGVTWSEVVVVSWSTPDRFFMNTSLVASPDGTLHAAWQANKGQRTDAISPPYAVLYAHSTDGGATWSTPVEFSSLDFGYADPTVFEDRSGRLHLVWNGAAGVPGGRYYSWSDDGGLSWAPVTELPGDFLGGRSGFPQVVEDSSGVLHVFHSPQMASEGGRGRYVSAYLTGHEWSIPVTVPEGGGFDMPALTIVGGNQLYALLWDFPGEVFYSTCLLNAPAILPQPTPTPSTLAVNPTKPMSSPTASVAVATLKPLEVVRDVAFAGDSVPPTTSQFYPVLVGAASALLVVMLGVAFARRRGVSR